MGDPLPQAVLLQAVGRLQHCSYPLVNDPRENLAAVRLRRAREGPKPKDPRATSCDVTLIRPRIAATDHPLNLRALPCGLEVDRGVNFRFFLGKAPIFQGMTL